VCARRRSNFLLSRQEKVTKEKATPSLRPPSPGGRRGQPAMLGPGVVPQNSLRSPFGRTPFKQLRQARSRSACVLRHTHPPQALRFSAQPEGVGAGSKTAAASQLRRVSVTRCALPTPTPKRSEGATAERSNGPCGARSHPLLTVPRSAGPGVSACRRTRASLSGSPKLFDRSCLAEAAQGVLRRHPRTEHRRLPPRPWGEGDTGSGAAFSLVTFSWRPRESYCAAGRTPRPPPSAREHK
jgi:hypothetical protein